MTKPRVISKAAIRRAERQGIAYIAQNWPCYLGKDENGDRKWNYDQLRLVDVFCDVYLHKRIQSNIRCSEDEYRVMTIGRGGNRKGRIDWATFDYEDYRDQVMRDFWSDLF